MALITGWSFLGEDGFELFVFEDEKTPHPGPLPGDRGEGTRPSTRE